MIVLIIMHGYDDDNGLRSRYFAVCIFDLFDEFFYSFKSEIKEGCL